MKRQHSHTDEIVTLQCCKCGKGTNHSRRALHDLKEIHGDNVSTQQFLLSLYRITPEHKHDVWLKDRIKERAL